MEGPYRDLGAGFARLLGPEGARRSPSRISSVEDALRELLRNSRDAGARNIYVASTLRNRRYRTLTVLDDGCGIPESHGDLIFEPGVTTRHLDPTLTSNDPSPHGAGLSLYHLRNASIHAEVASTSDPTSITATFDTRQIPERSLQSGSRNSRTNLSATLRKFLENTPGLYLYYASPARILATLAKNCIIQKGSSSYSGSGCDSEKLRESGQAVGLEVSLRTVQRIIRRELDGAEAMKPLAREQGKSGDQAGSRGGISLSLGPEETVEIEDILRRIVRSRYLEMGGLRVESRPGEIFFKAQVYELEDEYE